MWTAWEKLRNKCAVIQETQTIFGCIRKEEFELPLKKCVERVEVYLAANRRYFEKENVKCIQPWKVKMMRVNKFVFLFTFFFFFFRGVSITVFTKPAVTWDLFDVQISVGAWWKSSALQNTCASMEFRQMALQSLSRKKSTGFGTIFVYLKNSQNVTPWVFLLFTEGWWLRRNFWKFPGNYPQIYSKYLIKIRDGDFFSIEFRTKKSARTDIHSPPPPQDGDRGLERWYCWNIKLYRNEK